MLHATLLHGSAYSQWWWSTSYQLQFCHVWEHLGVMPNFNGWKWIFWTRFSRHTVEVFLFGHLQSNFSFLSYRCNHCKTIGVGIASIYGDTRKGINVGKTLGSSHDICGKFSGISLFMEFNVQRLKLCYANPICIHTHTLYTSTVYTDTKT